MKRDNIWAQNITDLQKIRRKREKEREVLKFRQQGVTKELRDCNKELNRIDKMIRLYKTREMIVNELAILRYQQLVENIDRSLVPDKIITPALHHMVTTLGDGEYPVNNFIAVVKNQIVVNIKLQAG